MQPLIDADVLCYEIGFAAETSWGKENGLPPFEKAEELLNNKIAYICAMVNATSPPKLYMTGKTNFRTDVAKTFIYKDRDGNKPFHYYNLKAYMEAVYDVTIQEPLEADDLMAIEQTRRDGDTIICTRDKDLRAVPGLHFGWELGNQPQFGPQLITELGYLQLSDKRNKLIGGGYLFFWGQCLVGDSVDTVPGVPGIGPVKAFKILEGTQTIQEGFNRVLEAYRGSYGQYAEERLLEHGRCLWMTRELNEDGSPKLWEFPCKDVIQDVTITQTLVSEKTV